MRWEGCMLRLDMGLGGSRMRLGRDLCLRK